MYTYQTFYPATTFLSSHALLLLLGASEEKKEWKSICECWFLARIFKFLVLWTLWCLLLCPYPNKTILMPTYFLGKILSSDLVTAHIRLKSSKNVESEQRLVPIKSRGIVVSCVWTFGLRELARVWGTITKFWVWSWVQLWHWQ